MQRPVPAGSCRFPPYMQPLFDNLNVIKHQFAANSSEVKRLEDMQKSEQLVIEALAFIRGRSLSETYCIIDEAHWTDCPDRVGLSAEYHR